MSNFQTNTLFGAILIAVFWLIFCVAILDIDTYVGVLGALASLCMGLWIGWNQKWMGFVGGVLSIFTSIGFVFSVIPVYNYSVSLNTFYAGQVPTIVCEKSNQGNIIIDSLTVSMSNICKRNGFPLIHEQNIEIKTPLPVMINLAMGRSILLQTGYQGAIKRTIEDGLPVYNFTTPSTINTSSQSTNQITIQQQFQQEKKEYLQKNYPRKREYAPTITKISLRKMRLLSLIDRSYSDKISSLELYMREVK